jgi:hypothetical protein
MGSNPGAYMAAYTQTADNYGPMLVGNGSGGVSPYGASPVDSRYLPMYGTQQIEQGLGTNGFDGARSGNGNSNNGSNIPGYFTGINSAASLISTPNTYGAVVGVPYGFQGYMPYQGITYAATPDAYGNSRTIQLQHLQPDSNNGVMTVSTPGAPIQTTKDLQGPDGCNLFVFHIPNDMTNNDLYSLFSEYGEVISARIMVDKTTGRSRGFGFVSFNERISAEDAIKGMNGCHIGHKRLKVQHKKEKDKIDHVTPTHLMHRNSSPSDGSPIPVPYFRHAFVGTEQTAVAANVEEESTIATSVPSHIFTKEDTDSLAERLQSKLNINEPIGERAANICEISTREGGESDKGHNFLSDTMRAPVATVEETLVGERSAASSDLGENTILKFSGSTWNSGFKNDNSVAEVN